MKVKWKGSTFLLSYGRVANSFSSLDIHISVKYLMQVDSSNTKVISWPGHPPNNFRFAKWRILLSFHNMVLKNYNFLGAVKL